MKCGELADGDSFPVISGVGARRKACHNCTNRQKKQDRIQRSIGVPAPRPSMELQDRSWLKWTAEDDKYLRENVGGMCYEDLAVALGRSLNAVYKRRDILGLATVRKRHRVEKPWKIQ